MMKSNTMNKTVINARIEVRVSKKKQPNIITTRHLNIILNIVYTYKNLLVYRFSLSSALNFGM